MHCSFTSVFLLQWSSKMKRYMYLPKLITLGEWCMYIEQLILTNLGYCADSPQRDIGEIGGRVDRIKAINHQNSVSGQIAKKNPLGSYLPYSA